MSRWTRVAVALAVGLMAAGCGPADTEPTAKEPTAAEARKYVREFFVGFGAGGDTIPPLYRTLHEVLPNVRFVHPDPPTHPNQSWTGGPSTDVVVGTVVDVRPGKGFYAKPNDGPTVTTDFADPRSQWWTVHATVEVERSLASQTPREIRVQFPSEGPTAFPLMAAGLEGLGRVVLFLEHHERDALTSYDRSLYRVIQDQGVMVARVDEDGKLSLPLMAWGRGVQLLRDTPRLQDLEEKSRTPREFRTTGGATPQRVD